MDITFHYFAVKTVAIKAGFKEDEAQRIATYSQYIDDYDWIAYRDCKNLPKYIKESNEYDLYIPNWWTANLNFNTATTGFSTIIDYAWLLLSSSQKFNVSAFHFIPRDKNYNPEVRTSPALIGDGSIISNMLIIARENFKTEDRKKVLMRIGMLLHTFADTYAHQLFSGYNSHINDIKVTKVINNINNQDISEIAINEINNYTEIMLQNVSHLPEAQNGLPYIGHMWAGNIPDSTNLSFEMKYKSTLQSDHDKTYFRNNTSTFITACKHILNFLRSCLGKTDIEEEEWEPFAENLKKGFLYEYPKENIENNLANHWKYIFEENTYFYSKNAVEDNFYLKNNENISTESILGTNYTEEFYNYNCLADEHLIYMYGKKPRKVK